MKRADVPEATARAIEDLVALDGGPLPPEPIGTTLPIDDLSPLVDRFEWLEGALNAVSSANGGPTVSGHLTRSPGMGATVRMVSDSHAAVLTSAGTLARMQVMHRLLLTNWKREGQPIGVIASVMDRPRKRPVPSGLAPLLSDLKGDGDWWQAIDALNATIALDRAFAPDVVELNNLSLSLLLCHEFAHVLRHHHELRRRVRAGELSFEVGDDAHRRPATAAELARAIEGDADLVAAYLVVVMLARQLRGNPDSLPRGFVRLAYALTALLALFDPDRLSVHEYGDASSYPHPLIRYAAYMDDMGDAAGQVKASQAFAANANFGAKKCLESLAWLESDILTEGRFGGVGPDFEASIHVLRSSSAFTFSLARMQDEQRALTLRLGTLITSEFGELKLAKS